MQNKHSWWVTAALAALGALNMAPSGCEGNVSPPDEGTTAGSAGSSSEPPGGDDHPGTHGGSAGTTHGSTGGSAHGGSAGGETHAGSGGTDHGGGDHTSAWPPWPNYYEEYPEKYWYLLYDPDKSASNHHSSDPADDCHANPPTEAQIRAVNDVAVRTAMFVEKLPIFDNIEAADPILAAEFGMNTRFNIPGLESFLERLGWHYIHQPGTMDPSVANPDNPELVIYLQTNLGYRPLGTMFREGENGEAPDFGGCLTTWHVHQGMEPLGIMLHVWTYGLETGPLSEPTCTIDLRERCVDPVPNPLEHPRR